MAITKKKTAIKKTIKPVAVKTETTVKKNVGRLGLVSWLLLPDLALSGAKMRWAIRALIFTITFLALTLAAGAIGVQSQLAGIGFTELTFHEALNITISSVMQFPLRAAVSAMLIFMIGAFMFMPRKLIAKDDAVAINCTYFVWLILSAAGVRAMSYFEVQSAWLTMPVFIVMITSLTAIFASVFLYARNFGVKKYVLFLTAPFGLGWFSWQALFMPGMGKKNVITIRMNLYKKLIDFILYTKYGQIGLAAFMIPLTVYFSPTPWDVATIAILGAMFFIKGGNWMMQRFQKFAWIAVILNLAATSTIGYILYTTPLIELIVKAASM